MIHMVQNIDNMDFEIILTLVRERSHVRGVAKTLGEPHSTVQRRLNRLVKENVLDYKREGRNKIFLIKNNLQAKNYVFNAEGYKLIRLIKEYPELSIIIEDLLKKTSERMILLFGSYAKFKAKKGSDIDVYIETDDKNVKEKAEGINSEIRVKIGVFDTQDLLIKEIIKNHVILRGMEEFYGKTRFFE